MNNMSMEAYKNLQIENEVYYKLKEAEKEAEIHSTRYSAKDVLKALKHFTTGQRKIRS